LSESKKNRAKRCLKCFLTK